MSTRSPNALTHVEKVVLAYSRTVSGTLSIVASILILNKIYRCCYKKRCISLNNPNHHHHHQNNNNNNNNNAIVPVAAAAVATFPPQPPTSTLEVSMTTTTSTPPPPPPPQLPVLYEEESPPSLSPLENNNNTDNHHHRNIHNRDELLVEDDGYTPLPLLLPPPQYPNTVETVTPTLAVTPSPATTTTTTATTNTTNTSQSSYGSSLLSLLSYTTVYQRLLIGTSVIDLFHSFWAALSTLPVPASSGVVYGHGTVTTCSIQGFFVQFSAATPIYFAALTFYFMSKVCYHSTDAALSQRYEIYFHVLPIIVAFGGGIIGVSLQLFNPIALPELGCWIAPYPIGCARTNTCTRGYKIAEYSDWYAWCLAFMWFFLSFIVVFVNTTMIYTTIYYRERYGPSHTRARMQQPPHLQTHTELPSSYGSSTVISNISSQNYKDSTTYENIDMSIIEPNEYRDENPNNTHESSNNMDQPPMEPLSQQQVDNSSNENVVANEIEEDDHDDHLEQDSECIDIPPIRSMTESNTSNTRTRDRNSSNNDSTASTIRTGIAARRRRLQQLVPGLSREHHQHQQNQQIQQQQVQQLRTSVRTSRIAAVQCVLYVSTALFTTVWSVMPWIGKKLAVTSKWRFFFAFMFNIFNPMQGFLTLIIFIRLQYLRLRVSEPNWSRIQCIRFCLFSPDAK